MFTEFEREVINHKIIKLGGYVFKTGFLLLDNDDKKCKQNSTFN